MKHVNVSLFVPHLGCQHRCVFCDQTAITGVRAPITREAVRSACEIASASPHDPKNSEIAFFGGSFTAVDRATQTMCLETAASFLGRGFSGIRVSTRPDAVDGEVLSFLKSYGVTAVELGAQSMDDAVLQKNERGHTARDTERACALIRESGLSLGLQMMTGLFGATDETDRATAKALIALQPDTVRIYPTVVLKNTRLARLYESGEYVPPGLENSVRLCAQLLELFNGANIRVIRLGLHSGADVQKTYVAGPYHPAFRELCETQLYKKALERLLLPLQPGAYTALVAPGHASKAAGHQRANTLYFASRGQRLRFIETQGIKPFEPQTAADGGGIKIKNKK